MTELERRRASRNDQQQEAFCRVVEGSSEHLRQLEAVAIELLSQLMHTEEGVRRTDVKIVLVSNGDTAWISSSIHGLLPGLEQYLNILQIEVVSARAKFSTIYPNNPAQWKVCCFADETRKAKIQFEAQLQAEASERAKEALAKLFAAQVMQSASKGSRERTGAGPDESLLSTPTHPSSVVSSLTENNSDVASQETWDSNTDDNDSCATMVPAKHTRSIRERGQYSSQEKKMRMNSRSDVIASKLVMPIPVERQKLPRCPQIIPVPAMQKQQEVLSEQHRLQHLAVIDTGLAIVDSKEVSDDDFSDKENTQDSLVGSEGRLRRRSRSPSFEGMDINNGSKSSSGLDAQPVVPELDLLVVSIGDGNHERTAVLLLGEHEPSIQVVSLKLLDALTPDELIRELQFCCENLKGVIDLAWTHPVLHGSDGVIFDPLDLMVVRTAHTSPPKRAGSSKSPESTALSSSWVFEFDIVDFFDEDEEIFTSVPSIDSGSFESNGEFQGRDLAMKGNTAGPEMVEEKGNERDSCHYYTAHSADTLEAKRSTAQVSATDSDSESAASRDEAGTGTESSEDEEADAKDYFRFNQKPGFNKLGN